MRRTLSSTFKQMARLEDQLVRAMMPRTSAADPAQPEVLAPPRPKATKTLTYKLSEVPRV